jgi:uncharacterized protein YbjT (DUF2867 family)
MTTVVISGGSGLVGSRVVPLLLARDDVSRVIALGRRALTVQHEKLASSAVDLGRVDAISAALPSRVDVAVCCLGTTMKQAGSKEAFRAVDHDAVLAFAKAALDKGAQRFLLVSALGANARAATFYARTKGEAEEALTRLGYAQLTVLRPSFIDDEGARAEQRLGERVLIPVWRAIFSVAGRHGRYALVSAETIARALVQLAFDETAERVRFVESEGIHALGH